MDELLGLLAAQARHLRVLIPLLEDQQRALQGADAAGVAALLERGDAILRAVAVLETRRQDRLHRVAADLGVEPGDLTLSRLAGLVPTARPRLQALRAELHELLTTLRTITDRNGFLLERVLGYLERLQGRLLACLAPTPAPTYAATGRTALVSAGLGLVNRRA